METHRLLVGAIDFGTTFSGWAYSFYHDFKADPRKGFLNKWNSGSGTLLTEKTPTSLLINPDGKTLEAFGYDAENMYRDLTENKAHENYYYFKKFKMVLNKKLGDKLDREMTLKDEMGKPLKAIEVFGMAIRYLVEDLMKTVNNGLTTRLEESDVHWVLTVPAIWTDAAKQFMREAAIEAGILTNKLTIALEPEAASIFCRYLSADTAVSGGNVSISQMSVGTRYMILDAGGGTIDITVHEVVSAESVREIRSASGGGWGGVLVDKAFENLLIDLVGEDVYETFKKSETEDWLDLWREFEVKKRTITPEKNLKVSIKIPLSFSNTVEKVTKNKFKDVVSSSKYSEDIDFRGDKIRFSANLFKSFFDDSLEKTTSHVKELMKDESVRKIQAIILVGGYSESPMLQQAIKEEFSQVNVIIPQGAATTILRGALVYGHSPECITERVLKFTYGVKVTKKFREGKDPEHLKKVTGTGVRCKAFSKHVEMGQTVKCKEKQVEKSYTTSHEFQRKIKVSVYASDVREPKYIDEGVYIGKVILHLQDPQELPGRRVLVSMTFGGTEIEVKAVDEKTGKEASASIDFLG